MEIAPEQKTTPRSMSFNARLCCKLAPPLAFNFLTLCFESGVQRVRTYTIYIHTYMCWCMHTGTHVPPSPSFHFRARPPTHPIHKTHQGSWMRSRLTGADVSSAFSRFYGSMDVIPFLGDNFNRAFPILIALLAVFQARAFRFCCCCLSVCMIVSVGR